MCRPCDCSVTLHGLHTRDDVRPAAALRCARMSERCALEARGVVKRYGSRDALLGVDLIARPGELHGLLGPNGAGKTTLMRAVLGLIRRDAGSVRVFDR